MRCVAPDLYNVFKSLIVMGNAIGLENAQTYSVLLSPKRRLPSDPSGKLGSIFMST
jgi:hypothetical protein